MAGLTLSCGVLVFDADARLLLCHATGTPRWDIPKGLCEPGETERQAAARETREETGLVLEPERLFDVGRFAYLPRKDLHLFAARVDRIDATRFVCTSHFTDAKGRTRPEMDAFAWFDLAEAPQRCGKSMALLLSRTVDLEPVQSALQVAAVRSGPMPWRLSSG